MARLGRPPKQGGTVNEQAARLLRTATRHRKEEAIREQARSLTEAEVTRALTLNEKDLQAMEHITGAIAEGRPSRNAGHYLTLLRTKLEFTREKPQQKVAVDGGLDITVKTLSMEYRPPVDSTSATIPALVEKVVKEGDEDVVPDDS